MRLTRSALGLCTLVATACSGDSFVAGTGNNRGQGGDGTGASSSGGSGASGGEGGTAGGSGASGGDGGTAGGGVSTGGTHFGTGGTGGRPGGTGGEAGSSGVPYTKLYASAYDQSCENDSQCSLVVEGDACLCANCVNAAVSRAAVDAYQADWEAIECPVEQIDIGCGPGCMDILPACVSGTCTTRTPVYIEEADFDRTCVEDNDCHLIFTGEICSDCRCATAAVNTGAFATYEAMLEAATCTPAPSLCDCAPPSAFSCVHDVDGETPHGLCTLSE
jgi:hypothetical protein